MKHCDHEICHRFEGILDQAKFILGVGRRGFVGAGTQYGSVIKDIDWTNRGTRPAEAQCNPLPWLDKLGTTEDPRYNRL